MNRSLNFNPEFVTKSIFPDIDHSIINFGRCFIWAYSAHLIFANVRLCSIDCHAFVKYQGKFYDSDMPSGVQNWETLPAASFTMHRTYRKQRIVDFKQEWNTQPARFKTTWREIERNAFQALKKLSYEESQETIVSCG